MNKGKKCSGQLTGSVKQQGGLASGLGKKKRNMIRVFFQIWIGMNKAKMEFGKNVYIFRQFVSTHPSFPPSINSSVYYSVHHPAIRPAAWLHFQLSIYSSFFSSHPSFHSSPNASFSTFLVFFILNTNIHQFSVPRTLEYWIWKHEHGEREVSVMVSACFNQIFLKPSGLK